MTRASFARAAIAIALVGLALRVGYVLALGAHPALGKDGTWYSLQAGTIGEGVGYVDPRRYYAFRGASPTAQFPPLWPGLLALVYDIGLGTLRDYRITGGFLGAGTVAMTAYLGKSVVNARVGLVAAAIVAVSPLMIAADGSLMAESLFIAFVTGALLVAVRAVRGPSLVGFAVLGVLLGLATLTRTDGAVIAIVVIGVTSLCAPAPWIRRVGFIATALAVVVVVLVPWTLRNSNAFGKPVLFSSNSGSLLAGANCEGTYGGREVGGWLAACVDAVDRQGGGELALAARERSAGLTYAGKHAGALTYVLPARIARGWGLWNPSVLADAEQIETRNRKMQLAAWPVSLAVLALGVGGGVMLVRRRGWAVPAPLFAVIGAGTLVLAGSWGNQRFRLVADPAVAVLAAVALVAGWSRIRTGARDRAG